MATQEEYLACFATIADAIEFQTQTLSIGDEFLPPIARAIRDDSSTEPTPDYWDFLIAQANTPTEVDEPRVTDHADHYPRATICDARTHRTLEDNAELTPGLLEDAQHPKNQDSGIYAVRDPDGYWRNLYPGEDGYPAVRVSVYSKPVATPDDTDSLAARGQERDAGR